MAFDAKQYYAAVQPQASSAVPYGAEMVAYEYRGFIVTRASSEYMLWEITLKEGKPPVPLRGSFTKKQRAESAIDDFLFKEEKKKDIK